MGLPGVLVDVFGKLLVVDASLLVSHGDSVVNGIGQFFRVPGVDDDAAVETLSCASEFGQDHGSMTLLLRCDVLVGHKVHAIAGRRNETDITDSVECNQLIKRDRLVHEVDGHEFDGAYDSLDGGMHVLSEELTKFAVDSADQLVHDSTEVLVLLDILS